MPSILFNQVFAYGWVWHIADRPIVHRFTSFPPHMICFPHQGFLKLRSSAIPTIRMATIKSTRQNIGLVGKMSSHANALTTSKRAFCAILLLIVVAFTTKAMQSAAASDVSTTRITAEAGHAMVRMGGRFYCTVIASLQVFRAPVPSTSESPLCRHPTVVVSAVARPNVARHAFSFRHVFTTN